MTEKTASASYLDEIAKVGTLDSSGSFTLSLQAALLSVAPTGPAPIQHLSVALRAVGFGQRRSFCLSISGGGRRRSLTWDGTDLRSQDQAESRARACTVELTVDFRDDQKGRLLGLLAAAVTLKAHPVWQAPLVAHSSRKVSPRRFCSAR